MSAREHRVLQTAVETVTQSDGFGRCCAIADLRAAPCRLWQGRAMRLGRATPEPSTAEKIGYVQQRLHIVSALAETWSQPEQVMQIVSASADPDQARARLQDAFGLDELQAAAVLDGQFRNATLTLVDRIRTDRDELIEELRRLQEQLRDEG